MRPLSAAAINCRGAFKLDFESYGLPYPASSGGKHKSPHPEIRAVRGARARK